MNEKMVERLAALSEGNPGAIRVLREMLAVGCGSADFGRLEAGGLTGSRIWVAYKDYAGQDVALLIDTLREVEGVDMKGMLAVVDRAFETPFITEAENW